MPSKSATPFDVPSESYPVNSRSLLRAAYGLSDEPRVQGSIKLTGPHDLYRIRVGDYRIVYRIDDARQIVTITIIAHRREVYRDL